jgi:HAE1 family hydrophobic/amphiphilic exporter-1
LPLAGIGVVLVLVFWDTTLNAQSFIGLVVLAGIVVNNAIVLVDYVNQLRRRHPDRELSDVIEQAAVRRFRPIVMTTLTTVLGMLPVALALGEGAELQAPLARVVVGGLISGTLITLVAIPLVCFVASSRKAARETGEVPGPRELVHA